MAPPQQADEKRPAALKRQVTGGLARAPPALQEPEVESASASHKLSTRDVVQERLGLRKATNSKSQDSSQLSKQSASGIDHSLEDYFKHPLGAAPRVSETSTVSASSSTSQSRSSGLGSMSTSTAPQTVSYASSSQKDRSQLPISCRGPPVSAGSPVVLLKSPSGLHHKVSPIASKISCSPSSTRDGDSEIEFGSVHTRLLSLSSPDLRTLKCGGKERQLPVAMSTSRSDENLLKRDKDTMVASDSQSWPAPQVLVLPVGLLEHPKIDLGTIHAGSPKTVVLALVNATNKSRRYRLQQLCSSIDGHAPKHLETVSAQFPGQPTVGARCVAKIQGSFLSMSPGAVEITVGIVAEDEVGGRITLVAQVEQPRIVLERSQSTNFEGDSCRARTQSTPENRVADEE